MTFNARETSRTKRRPITLFFFRYGVASTAYFAYTDAENDITYNSGDGEGAITYHAVTIQGGEIEKTGTLDKTKFAISLPDGSPLVSLFNPRPPSSVVVLKVYQGHVGESEFIVAWYGRVLGFSDNDKRQSTLNCEPFDTSLSRAIAHKHWQIGCNRNLFQKGCYASRAAATVSVVVSASALPVLTLPSGWNGSKVKEAFINGSCSWTDPATGRLEIRSIYGVTDATHIVLDAGIGNLPAGTTVSLTRSCTHDTDANTGCGSHVSTLAGDSGLSSNIVNYGGCKWIPIQNPVGIRAGGNGFY